MVEKQNQKAVGAPPNYAGAVKAGTSTVSLKTQEKTLIVYPKETTGTDKEESSKTRTRLMEVVKPRQLGLKINNVREVRKGGIAISLPKDSTLTTQELSTKMAGAYTVQEPGRKQPRMLIFDVSSDMTEEDVVGCIYAQNMTGRMTEAEFRQGFGLAFRTGPRGKALVNWVATVAPEIRAELLRLGHVCIEWSRCKVKDFPVISRCFNCQSFGHVSKYCKSKAVCGHCATEGHDTKDCTKRD